MNQFMMPVGRIVSGHPMKGNTVTDKTTKLPKKNTDGTPVLNYYVGYAIAKGVEADWKLTDWGQKISQEGVTGWPNGEHLSPGFAWKITDGDSQIPNTKGKKPCEREGWPGNWVIHISQQWPYPCYNTGHYLPHEVIQQAEAIKAGDYVRFEIGVKGNAPAESPGVYINPIQMELVRAGIQIITENIPDANAAFGAVAAVLPAGAMVDQSVAAPAPAPKPGAGAPAPAPVAPVAPAPEVLAPVVVSRNVDGQVYTEAALVAAGWTPEQIAAAPLAQ